MTRKRQWEVGSIAALLTTLLLAAGALGYRWRVDAALSAALEQHDARDTIVALLDRGARVNTRSQVYHTTALIEAAGWRDHALMQRLLSQGASLDLETRGGYTPLITSSAGGDGTGIELLLRNGADPNFRNVVGQTALTHAVQGRRATIVRQLLIAGARADLPDQEGLTPLGLAKRCRFREIVRMLEAAPSVSPLARTPPSPP